uniref:Uncharacterized protein n=1 Tax=Acrobeloides nanus TaxID=290746 RepID=A0A914E2S5_9BILA
MKLITLLLTLTSVKCSMLSLWNHVIKMEQVIASIPHYGRYLHVWEEKREKSNRYYVSPLFELENDSIHCLPDKYYEFERHIFRFSIKVWDHNTALKVKNELERKGHYSVDTNDILPLPMQMLRLNSDSGGLKDIELELGWRSFMTQPNNIVFELYTKYPKICEQMYNDSIQSPEEFLATTKLVIEFTILSDQQATRTLNITGHLIAKTEFFAFLNNEVSQDGIVYLTSTDQNKLARNITHSILAEEKITSDYISSSEEENIINEMLGVISKQKIQSAELIGDEWNSVFWDDIFTRPDIITEYANEIFTHDENTSHFKFDEQKENKYISDVKSNYEKKWQNTRTESSSGFFGLFKKKKTITETHSESNSTSDHNETYDRYNVSKDELLNFMDKNKFNVKWTGRQFEQKSMNLYRVNTKALESRGQLLYRRVVVTEIASTQKKEIRPQPGKNDTPALTETVS